MKFTDKCSIQTLIFCSHWSVYIQIKPSLSYKLDQLYQLVNFANVILVGENYKSF